ncbi:hypothetical protein ACN6K9_004074 [Streptomyces sp. SAS_267]|uniref:hypothetical protein n=1 Tax=Streptomyces sp. SAS_267 TaxID=3412750 RepID=UPI00403C9D64
MARPPARANICVCLGQDSPSLFRVEPSRGHHHTGRMLNYGRTCPMALRLARLRDLLLLPASRGLHATAGGQ